LRFSSKTNPTIAMNPKFTPEDQPPRDGGVDHPTAAQLDGATADGAPTPGAETRDFKEPGEDPLQRSDELAEERDRNLRLRAEIENVRSRTSRELLEQSRYAALPLARDLLPVLDNIDRAIEAAEKSGDAGPLVDGFRMVRQQLAAVLQQHHCVEMEPLGEPFDPQFHAAILQQPSPDVPANHVMMVTQSGYQLHDRVVRPAQVIVSSGKG
jgi:molecular chaperone GrpE